jgi:hypothetical protein
MIEVAQRESGLVHYLANGEVLKGRVTPADTGLMQVNCTYWCEDAERLGLDIWNITDNVKMARHIYDTQGITAWVAYNDHMAKR